MKRWLPFPVMWALLLAMWLVLNRTFFFGSYQRWTDRQLGSGR